MDTLQSIRQRRTFKILSEQPLPTHPVDQVFIETLLESAFYAPFHYPCHANHQTALPSPFPWRFYVLSSDSCRMLVKKLSGRVERTGRIFAMLNSADYLIQATWCPTPPSSPLVEEGVFDGTLMNMENIAAASAAVQNILLSATAAGYETYWSSGGSLRTDVAFDILNIPSTEILLGSIFIFPTEDKVPESSQCSLSKRRHQRGGSKDFYRIITL